MLMLKGVAVSILLPVWAAVMMLMVAVMSALVADDGGTPIELQLERLDLGTIDDAAMETALGVVVFGVAAVHLLAAVVTSRAVAAMAGSVGGLIGAVLAGLGALMLAMTPSSLRVEALRALTHPGIIVFLAILAAVLGFRAYLAHIGRWRYPKRSAVDHWDGGFD
jgi:hypothetical protein